MSEYSKVIARSLELRLETAHSVSLTGLEEELNISKKALKEAVDLLVAQGYVKHIVKLKDPDNPEKYYLQTIVARPGISQSDIFRAHSK